MSNSNIDKLDLSIAARKSLISKYNEKLTQYFEELYTDIQEKRRLLIIKDIRAIRKNRKEEKLLLRQEKSFRKCLLRNNR